MSGIVLSASVRQNLLSLQSTADLLSTTQNRLATGNKVNSALDNPTNFFTAQGLDNRAGDINNLLDSIGNGVQVLQAANTGITSLQKLVDTAKSIANQALQVPTGYSTKSQIVGAANSGATASNILGGTNTNAVATAGTAVATLTAATSGSLTAAGVYAGAEFVGGGGSDDTITIDGKTITFDGTTDGTTAIADGTNHKYTVSEAVDKINHDLGVASSTVTAVVGTGADAGKIVLTNSATGTSSNFAVAPGTTAGGGFGTSTVNATSGADATGGIDASGGDLTFNVNGKTVTLSTTGGANGHYDAAAVAAAINSQVGTSASVNATAASNKLTITSTGTGGTSDQVKIDTFTGTGFDATDLGFAAATETDNGSSTGGLSGLTLQIASTAGGTAANVTFGTASGQIKTLDQLNVALKDTNLTASIDSTGALTITTVNDHAATTIGAVTGTAVTTTGSPLLSASPSAPVEDANAQNTRATLISQYNAVIDQIRTTAQDSSFNGVNLLNSDQLKLVFNETGKSTLEIQGVTFDPAGLGLSSLTSGTDFLDNSNTNGILDTLNNASNTLRSQASTFGSNLSIVQIRQDFNKNLINVLQTGSSNLTLADTNEEAANSQALSTRQSIAVSALALANQSNQSVLQLLR